MQANIYHQLENIASKSKTDDIFVVGKGPSIDEINGFAFPDGVVINLNDSERIRPGHLGVFSDNWVRHSLAEHGFRCDFYLAGKPLPTDVDHEVLPPLPLELDREELSVFRLNLPDFYDDPLVLLNALKACNHIAQIRGRLQNVYLLGLDFSTQGGDLSAKITRDYTGASHDEREAIVHAQETHFRQFQRSAETKGLVRLLHVGHRDYSAMTPAGLIRQFAPEGAAAARKPELTGDEKVLVVAELTNNHLGDPQRIVEMVERSKEAGADLIKVQKRDVDTFYTQEQLQSEYWSPFGNTLGDYRRGVELTDEMLDLLDETCRRNQIEWFCTVLDYSSFEAIRRFDPQLMKVPSTISGHREFHQKLAAAYDGPIVVSTGGTEWDYVEYILDTFGRNERLYLLHCVSAYPTPREACNIAVLQSYVELARKDPRIVPGYSSHDLGSLGCMLAVASGARMIEKHVKLGDVEWVHFDKVALDLRTDDFDRFVRDVRDAQEAMGNSRKRILDCEHHKYPTKHITRQTIQ